MKIKHFVIAAIILLTLPFKVQAFDDTYNNHTGCKFTDIIALKNAVSAVKIRYDYDQTNLMTVTLSNLTSDFYAVDLENNIYFLYDSNKETPNIASVSEYFDDQIISLKFVASKSSVCSGEEIVIRNFRLPRYNRFYGSKECEGIDPDKFSLCSKWYPSTITEVDFLSALTRYKEKINSETIVESEEKKALNSIVDLLLDYYQYVLYGILGLSLIIIIILKIKEKQKRVL